MKIAIIGAGLAGLTAARQLQQRGIAVDVFEKSRGSGGRLANKRLDWAHLDLGAQYFTARDPRFIEQVQQWQRAGAVAHWDFTPHKLGPQGLQPSPDTTRRYVGVPAMNQLAKVLTADLNIAFGTRITQLDHRQGQWRLTTEQGELFSGYHRLLLAIPAEQARPLLAHWPIAEQIPTSAHHPCWALALATRGAVHGDSAGNAIAGIFGDATVSWVSRLSARPQRPVFDGYDDLWMLHFSGPWSLAQDDKTTVDIAATGLAWLHSALAAHLEVPLEVVNHYQHYWRYARPHPDCKSNAVIIDDDLGLGVIGDWTQGGRIEGAFLSAMRFIEQL